MDVIESHLVEPKDRGISECQGTPLPIKPHNIFTQDTIFGISFFQLLGASYRARYSKGSNNTKLQSLEHFSNLQLNPKENTFSIQFMSQKAMLLIDLPNEVLLLISTSLGHERNISALSRTNRRLYSCLQRFLIQYNIQHSRSSVLLWAAERGNESLTRTVLEEGGCGHVVDRRKKFSALTLAVIHNHESIVRLLLTCEDVNANWNSDITRKTALTLAAERGNIELVSILLGSGYVNPNGKCGEPLSFASENGHEPVVKLLLDHPDIKLEFNSFINSPLSLAASNGHVGIVKMLLDSGMEPNDQQWGGSRPPLLWASLFGHAPVVALLLTCNRVVADGRYDQDRTPLSFAAGSGHLEVVELLLGTGAVEPNSRDIQERTPLYWAVNWDYDDSPESSLTLNTRKNVEEVDFGGLYSDSIGAKSRCERKLNRIIEVLLENGADPDSKDDEGHTPLTAAIERRRAGLMKTLLATGKIDLTHKDVDGRTPLDLAKIIGDAEILSLILEATKK